MIPKRLMHWLWNLIYYRTSKPGKTAGQRLAELTRENGFHIGTGFVGTPILCDALSSMGYYAEAFKLLTQQECPSWLYPVTMGANDDLGTLGQHASGWFN